MERGAIPFLYVHAKPSLLEIPKSKFTLERVLTINRKSEFAGPSLHFDSSFLPLY